MISRSQRNPVFCNLHKRSYGKLIPVGWFRLSDFSINPAALQRFAFLIYFLIYTSMASLYKSYTVHGCA